MESIEKYKDITIIVSSCDKFKDAWEPFFILLDKYWSNHPRKIFLNSESVSYSGSFQNVRTVLNTHNESWSERIRNTVKQVDTEYVLFFLEDYFIWDYVNEEVFDEAYSLIKDEKVGAVVFHGVSLDEKYNTRFNTEKVFVEQDKSIISRLHVVVSLFHKDYFLKLLCENENPWRYERESYARSLALGKKVLAQNYGCSKPCFLYYLKPRDNIGINQGKWLKDTIPMFEKNGITSIDYCNLGVYEEYLHPNMDKDIKKLKQKGFKEVLHEKIFKKIKYSLFGRRLKSVYYRFYYSFLYKE